MNMKLVFISGDERGRVCDCAAPGVSLGREGDNDIVLLDEQVSRYHAKVLFEEGIWQAADLDSRNGTSLNGEPLGERHPLSLGDQLRLGSTILVFTDEDGVDKALVAPDWGADDDGEPASDAADPTKRRQRILLLGLVLLIVIVLVGAAALLKAPAAAPPTNGGGNGAPAPIAGRELLVHFVKQESSPDSVFRYELLLENGRLSVKVDDLKSDWHPSPEPRQLENGQLEALVRDLMKKEFLELKPVPPVQGRDKDERLQLVVAAGEKGNVVDLVNVRRPPVVRDIVHELEELVAGEFEISGEAEDPEEVIARAEDDYRKGIQYFDQRTLDMKNLHRAILQFRRVVERLQWRDPRPEFYEDTVSRLEEAQDLFNDHVEQLLGDARVEERAGAYDGAEEKFRQVCDMMDYDRNDERYEEARKGVVRIKNRRQR